MPREIFPAAVVEKTIAKVHGLRVVIRKKRMESLSLLHANHPEKVAMTGALILMRSLQEETKMMMTGVQSASLAAVSPISLRAVPMVVVEMILTETRARLAEAGRKEVKTGPHEVLEVVGHSTRKKVVFPANGRMI